MAAGHFSVSEQGGSMADTFTCDRCGRVFESRQLKEVMYEEGRERIRKEFCPRCLDEVMNRSASGRSVTRRASSRGSAR